MLVQEFNASENLRFYYGGTLLVSSSIELFNPQDLSRKRNRTTETIILRNDCRSDQRDRRISNNKLEHTSELLVYDHKLYDSSTPFTKTNAANCYFADPFFANIAAAERISS